MLTSTRGISTPPVRRESRDSFRQSRPKSMPNLDDANVNVQHDTDSLRNSASIGNVVATAGESTQDRRSYETRDMRSASIESAPYTRASDTGKAK